MTTRELIHNCVIVVTLVAGFTCIVTNGMSCERGMAAQREETNKRRLQLQGMCIDTTHEVLACKAIFGY